MSYSAAALAAGVALLASACGSSNGSLFDNGGVDAGLAGPYNGDGSANFFEAGTFSLDALAAEDPPNLWCGPEAGAPPNPPPIGGSPDCPTDKNLQGCPCGPAGTTAACWPGLRSNRNVGDCKDGVTTCNTMGEVGAEWGPCVGAVLPDPTGTTAAEQCSCFTQGQWHIDNLVPFFVTYSDGTTYAVSTTQDPDGGATQFPSLDGGISEPPPVPTQEWSTDELTVACAGTFTLCYQLKGGDFNNPQPTDCAISDKLCLPATFYTTAGMSQIFPPLPAWESTAAESSCAANFHQNGGYGEMSVLGQSVLCQEIDNGTGGSFVFHRIQYCPAATPNCGQDGSGTFK